MKWLQLLCKNWLVLYHISLAWQLDLLVGRRQWNLVILMIKRDCVCIDKLTFSIAKWLYLLYSHHSVWLGVANRLNRISNIRLTHISVQFVTIILNVCIEWPLIMIKSKAHLFTWPTVYGKHIAGRSWILDISLMRLSLYDIRPKAIRLRIVEDWRRWGG